jgi:hypothetical protein
MSKFLQLCESHYPKGADKFDEFLTKRAAGAAKIEKSAKEKGGYSILTAYHFAGKKKPYADSKKWESKEAKDKHYKEKAMEALEKLKDLDNLTQKEFQMISGEFEVYGEVYIRSVKGE